MNRHAGGQAFSIQPRPERLGKTGAFSRLTMGGGATMVRALQGVPRSQKRRSGRLVARLKPMAFPQAGGTSWRKWARSSAVEHLTFNQRVDGSIPSGLTTFRISEGDCGAGS